MHQSSKPYNGGQWTQARMNSFIKGALRQASLRWPPRNETKKNARVRRGTYLCKGYEVEEHEVTASLPPKEGNKKRINNAVVDHIDPIISPQEGFIGWDSVISKMFCEEKDLQLLCHDCHKRKTDDERKSKWM